MENSYNSVKERIKFIRHSVGFTQKKFGEALGVSDAHISKIESGKDLPSASLLRVISYIFRVNRIWLSTGEGEIFSTAGKILKRNFDSLIEEYNLSKEECINKIGMTEAEFGLLEIGMVNIDIDTLVNISNFFDISTDWLLKDIVSLETHSFITKQENQLLTLFQGLNSENKDLLLNIAKKFNEISNA